MLYKSIFHGKDWRRLKWVGNRISSNFDMTCRCHGGCGWCEGNRLHSYRKRKSAAEEAIAEIMKYGYEDDLQPEE